MDWETDVKPIVTGVVRHVITGAATALGGAGVLSSDQQTQFVSIASATLLYGVSLGWSAWQKRHQKAKVVEAAQTGAVK